MTHTNGKLACVQDLFNSLTNEGTSKILQLIQKIIWRVDTYIFQQR